MPTGAGRVFIGLTLSLFSRILFVIDLDFVEDIVGWIEAELLGKGKGIDGRCRNAGYPAPPGEVLSELNGWPVVYPAIGALPQRPHSQPVRALFRCHVLQLS